ncbi:MAG: glutamine amidotransferase [Eubacterium sp.]|nr:glutamine amidotransferase [Eubacterium sp.]
MSEVKLNICHMYPEVLNLYGDRGNILCLMKRLEWRGIECNLFEVKIGDVDDLTKYDLFFIGGGQDFEQEVLLNDLKSAKGRNMKAAIEDGKTFLCICGGYQMMGHYYETKNKEKLEFLGAIDFHTIGSDERMIDNYVFKCNKESGGSDIVGFENHSGKTYLSDGVNPLGTVIRGFGNNGEDKTEGVRYKNVYGSYSHGALLPKNPEFADHLILTTLERKYGSYDLPVLGDSAEREAHDYMLDKVLRGTTSGD